MPISAAKLSVDVDANTADAERKLDGMGDTVQGSAGSFGVMGKAAKALGAGLVVAGGAGLTMGLKTASGLEQAKIGFTTMLGSGQKADAFLSDLKDFAASTPFEFPDLVASSQKLLAMGFAAKDVRPTLTAIGDAVAGLGGGPEMVDRVTMALGQMQAKGKVSSEELLQLTEAGIPALKILADGYGVTTGEMQEMVSSGKVLADKAIPKLVKGLNEGTKSTAGFGGMMAKQSKTMAGTWSTFMDTLQMGLAEAVQPLLPVIADALPKAATAMGAALKAIVPVFSSLVSGVMAFVDAWTGGTSNLKGSGFSAWMANLAAVVKPLLSGFMSVGLVIGGVLLTAVKALGTVLLPVLKYLAQNPAIMKAVGAAIAVALVPALLVAVKAWGAAKIAAMRAGLASLKASALTVAGWVKTAAAATASWATTARIWLMYRLEAMKAAAAQMAASARIAAAWVAMQARAMASAIKMKLAWFVGIISQGAKAAATMAVTAARVVAGWVLMGLQSMLGAAKMAAAWFIALGPIGWATAAIVAIALLVWKNWDKIVAWTKAAWSKVTSWVTGAWSKIKAGVASATSWVSSKVSAAWGAVKSKTAAIWSGIKSAISNAWSAIRSAVSNAVSAVRSVISSVFSAITSLVQRSLNGWRRIITTVWSAIRSAVSSALSAVRSTVSSGFNAVRSAISSAMSAARSLISNAWSSIRSTVSNAVNGLMSTVRAIPGRITSALGNLGGLLVNSGRSLISGFVDGIRQMASAPADAVRGLLDRARNLFPFSPAKTGPFSGKGWTLYSGRSIASALGEGIGQKTAQVRSAAEALAKAAAPDLSDTQTALSASLGRTARAAASTPASLAYGAGTARVEAGGTARPPAPSDDGGGRTGHVFNFHTYNPVEEPTSVTTNRALDRVAALPMV